jgi:hypothetical protein
VTWATGFIPLWIHALGNFLASMSTAVIMYEGTALARKEQVVDLSAWH